VIDRFKWGVCCTLFLLLQCLLVTSSPRAAAEIPAGSAGAESVSVPEGDAELNTPVSEEVVLPAQVVEGLPPTASIPPGNPTVAVDIVNSVLNDGANSSQVIFTFSEAPTNFTATDILAVGGTISDLQPYLVGDTTGKTYTAAFSADDDFDGTGSVTVGGDWQGNMGNPGVGGNDTVTIDTKNPTVTEVMASDPVVTDADVGPGRLSIRVTFSEAVDTAIAPLLAFGSDVVGSLTLVNGSWDGTATIHTATYDVSDTNSNLPAITVAVAGGQDGSGNRQQDYTPSATFSIDTENPTVLVDIVSASLSDGSTSSPLTLVFSESPADFTDADLLVVGGTVSGLAPRLDGDTTGKTYLATFTADAGFDGTATVTVGTDWQDAAGNTGVGGSDTVVVAVTGERSLASLIGKSEISVFADVDGQFVKSLSEHQVFAEEFARQADEANLSDSIQAGRSFNRDSLAILARTEQAKAQSGQALALLLPSVSLRGSRGYETSEPSVRLDAQGEPIAHDEHMRTDASLTVRQPLFDLPGFLDWRRRRVIEQARGESYRGSDGDAYVSAVNAYLSLVSTRVQAEITRAFEAQLADLLSYIEKRASAGAASVSDMTRVRARREATLSSRLEQESAAAAAGVEFVRLTNLVPQTVRLPVLDDVGAEFLPPSVDQAVTAAMTSNPEIAALCAEVRAAGIDKSAAKGRYLPRLDAEYTDTYSRGAGGAVDEQGELEGQRDRRAMLVLNWNLVNGGGDYQYHAERSARHKELQYRLDDQRRRVIQTLSANYAMLATTGERIDSGYKELESITTAADAMSKRMLSGNQSLLDLLDVYDRLYQARSRLVSLHILEMSTVAQLVRITRGTPEALPDESPMAAKGPAAAENSPKEVQ